jgi:hypothetical protein
MVTNDVAGNLFPFMIVVKGQTFRTLDKFTHGNHAKWNASGPHLKAAGRTKFLLDVAAPTTMVHSSIQCIVLPCIVNGLA